jgi:hypothetical protein
MVPKEVAAYNSTHRALYFLNGSVIKFGNYQPKTGEQEYQGQEYDWIFMDEATQFTEREFRFLGGLLRGVNDIPKRFYVTCNPAVSGISGSSGCLSTDSSRRMRHATRKTKIPMTTVLFLPPWRTIPT